jgi:hypothetical protein
MKVLSLFEEELRPPNDYTVGQVGRKSNIEVDFGPSGIFLTYSKPSQELLAWLDNVAFDAFAVNYLKDGGKAVISTMSVHDSYCLRAAFMNEFEFSLVKSSRPAVEVIADVARRS